MTNLEKREIKRETKKEMISRLSQEAWIIVVCDHCLPEILFVSHTGFLPYAICAQWIFDYAEAEERLQALKIAFPAVESFTIEHPSKYMECNK